MIDYEKLGVFYLGRPLDMTTGKARDGEVLLYDSKDLVTHGVCFGMTGSGKTGLCVVLLEEAAIDGIPAIVIDPKGDLTNLLLTFPDLQPSDFRPWISDGQARQQGVSPDEYAAQQAALWKKGLASWDEQPARIARLKESADFAIYTPGSEAGLPVSLLKSFDAPPPEVREDRDLMLGAVSATASSLLGLLGIDADPVQSREHILLSLILQAAWTEGRNLDLPTLILEIQKPPVQRVGVFELESFYPAKERMGLAMQLNNILASPGFASWLDGEPLEMGRMLYTAEGKPRISIFSIAHLSDSERMFFVSLLLNQMVNWMRQQPGTTTLRALLYMDEIFGYFPPVANPPSKTPLMTLLKQARAFGLGVVLATQNPMDLDYKGLSNAGTWLIGRLQTDRDQARVLEGLEAAAAGAGIPFDRDVMSRTISGLGKRRFLLYNVHDRVPELFETRWALSYLCGPLTRDQIKTLTAEHKAAAAEARPAGKPQTTAAAVLDSVAKARPALPPAIRQAFVPARLRPKSPKSTLTYEPVLFGAARIQYSDSKLGVDETRDATVITHFDDGLVAVDWHKADDFPFDVSSLDTEPAGDATFQAPPSQAGDPKNYDRWAKDLTSWLQSENCIVLYRSPSLKTVSKPGEPERDFRIRLELAAREQRDQAVDDLRRRYQPKVERLADQIRTAELRVAKEQQEAQAQRIQSGIAIGTSILGALFGRKILSAATATRARSAMSSVGRATKESGDVERAQEALNDLYEKKQELEQQLQGDIDRMELQFSPRLESLETIEVRPKKSAISVRLVGLLWLPYWQTPDGGGLDPAWVQ